MPDQSENPTPSTPTVTDHAAVPTTAEAPPTGSDLQAVVATPSEKPKRSWPTAVADVFRNLIPERVSKLEGEYGPALFVGFGLGLVIGAVFAFGALVGSESLRTALLPPPTKDGGGLPAPATSPEKITSVTFVEAESPPPLFHDYEMLLGYIGAREQPSKNVDSPPMGAVVLEISKPTQAFIFPLEPRSRGSQIYAYLFRQFKVGSSDFFEPLISLPGSNVSKIRFKVPECNAGDKLFMFVLVIPPAQPDSVGKFTDYFSTGPPE
jgi:hypothetical protein